MHIQKTATRLLMMASLLSLLQACVSTPQQKDSNWYIRSEFTWWEARPEFMLRKSNDENLYTATFSLTPDGSDFHLKVSDKLWSQDKNCGVPTNRTINRITLGQWLPLDCDYTGEKVTPLSNSYMFKPSQNGLFLVQVRFETGRPSAFKITNKN